MSHSGPFDYLIVGQGLAGTCLAHCLESNFNKKVFFVDRDGGERCSRKAAGTFNPIVPRTFTSTWKSHELIPFLNNFYREFGEKLGLNLLNHQPVFKMFHDANQRNVWKDKSKDEATAPFMDHEIVEKIEGVTGPFGFGVVKQSGNIDMVGMLDAYRIHLKEKDLLLEESFDYDCLEFKKEHIEYKNMKVNKVVFCLGHENKENPFFKDLPFKLAKGEILIIKVKNWNPKGIINNKINIVPMGNELYWAGSTFDWENLNTEVSQAGKKGLIAQIKKTISVEFEVVEHVAGIRPTVRDRRPLLGEHQKLKNIYVFNGMGTRGVMLAPYFANQMALHMEYGEKLDKEADIRRFSEST